MTGLPDSLFLFLIVFIYNGFTLFIFQRNNFSISNAAKLIFFFVHVFFARTPFLPNYEWMSVFLFTFTRFVTVIVKILQISSHTKSKKKELSRILQTSWPIIRRPKGSTEYGPLFRKTFSHIINVGVTIHKYIVGSLWALSPFTY